MNTPHIPWSLVSLYRYSDLALIVYGNLPKSIPFSGTFAYTPSLRQRNCVGFPPIFPMRFINFIPNQRELTLPLIIFMNILQK